MVLSCFLRVCIGSSTSSWSGAERKQDQAGSRSRRPERVSENGGSVQCLTSLTVVSMVHVVRHFTAEHGVVRCSGVIWIFLRCADDSNKK